MTITPAFIEELVRTNQIASMELIIIPPKSIGEQAVTINKIDITKDYVSIGYPFSMKDVEQITANLDGVLVGDGSVVYKKLCYYRPTDCYIFKKEIAVEDEELESTKEEVVVIPDPNFTPVPKIPVGPKLEDLK